MFMCEMCTMGKRRECLCVCKERLSMTACVGVCVGIVVCMEACGVSKGVCMWRRHLRMCVCVYKVSECAYV